MVQLCAWSIQWLCLQQTGKKSPWRQLERSNGNCSKRTALSRLSYTEAHFQEVAGLAIADGMHFCFDNWNELY